MAKVVSDLINLGYNESLNSELLKQSLTDGYPEMLFIDIVRWLSKALGDLCGFESHISPVSGTEDIIGFLVEVSSLLKEMCCPIKLLTRGPITDRLDAASNKLLLLMYFSTELQAAKILALKKPKKETTLQIELAESKTAKELKQMLISLRFSKPPDNITPQMLFSEVEKKIYTLSSPKSPKEYVGQLLFSGCLTEKQWFQLEHLYKEMYAEYKTRRSLLLTRLDVTVQSFLWTDRLKNKSEDTLNMYNKKRSGISVEPSVDISLILAATSDLAIIEKTSSVSVRKNTKSAVNRVLIGNVPDRGGRPEEQQPPPPEVPSWQKNDSGRGGMKQSFQQTTQKSNFSQNRSYDNVNQRGGYGDGQGKRDTYNQGSYKGNREIHRNSNKETEYTAPMYQQPVQYCGHAVNQQFGGFGGFGGYGSVGPAGDNFHQYGSSDVGNQYAPRARGGYSDRGSNQFRGRSRGRGRW